MNKVMKGFTLVEIMIVVAIIAILAAVAIPNFVKYRQSSQATACVANLKQIQAAKENFMMNNTSAPTDVKALVTAKLLKVEPKCPAGGTYTVGGDGVDPTCSKARTIDAEDKSTWHDLVKDDTAAEASEGT